MLTLCPDSCLLVHGGVATEAGLSGTRRQQEAADGGTAGTRHQLNCDPASSTAQCHAPLSSHHTLLRSRGGHQCVTSQCPGPQYTTAAVSSLSGVSREVRCVWWLVTGGGGGTTAAPCPRQLLTIRPTHDTAAAPTGQSRPRARGGGAVSTNGSAAEAVMWVHSVTPVSGGSWPGPGLALSAPLGLRHQIL